MPELRRRAGAAATEGHADERRVRHLYVHLPFCAHRCGYCDFVTAVGRHDQHGAYVDALLAELELERGVLAPRLETIFLGGGTPTFTAPAALERLLAGAARRGRGHGRGESGDRDARARRGFCHETVSTACRWARRASSRRFWTCWSGARSPRTSAAPCTFSVMPDFDNISLDLIYGIPGQTPADLDADLAEALALEPEHVSCYELEAKPGTRFTHAHGVELERQAESMETYFERVVATLTAAGYRWYETANFCRAEDGRDLRARHNLGVLARTGLPRARDRRGLDNRRLSGGGTRRGWRPTSRALAEGRQPPRELEPLDDETRRRERVLLGLRLDEPLLARRPGGRGRPRRARAAGAAGPGRPHRRERRRDADADRAGPFPRRRRHRRPPGVEFPCTDVISPGPDLSERQRGDPRPGGRGVRRHRPAGRLEEPRRARRHARVVGDRPQRARRARAPRPAHAPAHVGRARPDRPWLPLLRRSPARAASAAAGELPARPERARGARSSRRSRRRPRCSRR